MEMNEYVLAGCFNQFIGNMGRERTSVFSAYKAYGEDCADMLVSEVRSA
jgi:hypothetical protein